MNDIVSDLQSPIRLTADIVCAFVVHNHIAPSELPGLIASVHGAISKIAIGAAPEPSEEALQKPTPAQIRKSITPDALISFIDGMAYKTLKRHLTKHGLDPHTYRERYGLPADYPTTSANYSAQRSALAKSLGLGRADASEMPEEKPAPAPETKAVRPRSRKVTAQPAE